MNRDQLLEVLLEHERRGHAVARLLELTVYERCAVGDREDRDAHAEHEEDDRQEHVAGRAGERQQRDARRRWCAPRAPLERAYQGSQQPRGGDGKHEQYESGQQEQQHTGSSALRQR